MPRRGLEIVPVDPLPSDCEGFPEVVIGAIDRDMSRPAALMHQGNGCSHNMYEVTWTTKQELGGGSESRSFLRAALCTAKCIAVLNGVA